MPLPPIPIDVRLLAMIVHDIRNPLNVIGLTLRVIEQMPSHLRNDIHEDLGYLRDNAGQIEKMLLLLSDLCRLHESTDSLELQQIDPARFVEDILEERAYRATEKAFPARFKKDPTTPVSVKLDPIRARFALRCVLENAATSSDRPLQVETSGNGNHWSITVQSDTPPPATAHSRTVESDQYERLLATPAERRGLGVAIAAWISAELGGTVRFEATPDVGTSIVIDWPIEAAEPVSESRH